MASYNQVQDIARKINWNLYWAIACYEVFIPTARSAELIAHINKQVLHPSFNTISDTVHRRIVIEICKIWDRRRGAASLPQFAKHVRKTATLDAIEHSTYSRPTGATLSKLDKLVAKALAFEPLRALQEARNRVLAHTEDEYIAQGRAVRRSVYGDERKAIALSVEAVEMVNEIGGYEPIIPYSDQHALWKQYADDFWQHIIER